MNSQMAITSEPNAMDPRWYLRIHLKPLLIEALPPESAVLVKYHVAQATARTNWEQPMKNALIQKRPNKL